MLNEQTMEKLFALKLLGMAEAFKAQLQQPSIDDLSFADAILDRLVHNAHRLNLKGGTLRKKSRFDLE